MAELSLATQKARKSCGLLEGHALLLQAELKKRRALGPGTVGKIFLGGGGGGGGEAPNFLGGGGLQKGAPWAGPVYSLFARGVLAACHTRA